MKINFAVNNILFLFVASLLFATTANGQAYGQYGQYGQSGGYGSATPAQSILVDKLIGKPGTSQTKGGVTGLQYVDNITASDYRFKPGDEVSFTVKVKNTSNNALNDIIMNDKLPSYMEPLAGPGDYNSASRMIAVKVGTLNAGEEKTYNLKMKIVSQDKMPADKGVICISNVAEAMAANTRDDDSTQFCIEKQVNGATSVPAAGPEMGLALISGQFALLGLGFFLKKKSA